MSVGATKPIWPTRHPRHQAWRHRPPGHQHSVSAITTTLRIRRVGGLGDIRRLNPPSVCSSMAYRSRSLLGTGDLLDVKY
jgi:hypothetical protein